MKTYQITFTDEIEVADDTDEHEIVELYLQDIENEPQQDLVSHFISKLKTRLIFVSKD